MAAGYTKEAYQTASNLTETKNVKQYCILNHASITKLNKKCRSAVKTVELDVGRQ